MIGCGDLAKKKATEICVEDILKDFAELPDPRSHVNQRHLLGDIIVISIMAVIAGAEGPKAIGVWAKSNEVWLKARLELPSGVPSHDTIGRVLMTLKPSAFQICFERWIKRLSGKRDEGELDVVAIDGKALRRSHDHSGGLEPIGEKDYLLGAKLRIAWLPLDKSRRKWLSSFLEVQMLWGEIIADAAISAEWDLRHILSVKSGLQFSY